MSRGNQRDRDRERAQARNSSKGGKCRGDGLTPEQRRERDAKALQEKLAKKSAQAPAAPAGQKAQAVRPSHTHASDRVNVEMGHP
ncbi:hypothetical protein R1sor_018179 [Riccia sorocarpa]|uniref:Small EDRK-rich factor-like N-terminal domain-containing protein n=1 Tax=Riccia sorocarpa TaxID=122646 RepID=A0ABD3I940_9MARC